jgi:hypothetical protein
MDGDEDEWVHTDNPSGGDHVAFQSETVRLLDALQVMNGCIFLTHN